MNNEHKVNEIDDIFKSAIEPVDTEPSDKFWRKAAEDVISRESKLNERKASRWRAIAFILGFGLMVLGYFTYKMESGIKSKELQITTAKQKQNSETGRGVPIKTNDNPIATSSGNKSTEEARTNSNEESSSKYTNPNKGIGNTIINNNASTSNSNKSLSVSIAINNPFARELSNKEQVLPIEYKGDTKSSINKQETSASDEKNQISSQSNSLNILSIQNSVQMNGGSDQSKASESTLKTNELTSITSKDTIKANINGTKSADSNLSRFSVSTFFAPDFMVNYKFKSDNSSGAITENIIKTGEKQNFSYSAGAKLEYGLFSRLTISLGVTYQVFSFDEKPQVIYAQKQSDGHIGYYLTTSSGIVECPYYGTPAIGDSLKMTASSIRSYLEIPVLVKYFFINKVKYKIYIVGGLEANICMSEKTTMNWQDYWNESGVASVTGAEGSENMYMSYYLGGGIDYKIGKCSLYLEPGFHEAATSLTNNTSLTTYPQLFSITAGLTYHLR